MNKPGTRPNLILFQADQLRADALQAFAPLRNTAHTPVLDALSERSTIFQDAFVQHPVCGPSRVSLMTGWYPHVHGHRTLTNLLKPWHPNLLRILRDSGYNTCFAGRRGDLFAPGVTEASTDFCGYLVKPQSFYVNPTQPEGSPLWNAMYHGRRPEPVCDMDEATIRTAEQWLKDGPREPWVLYVPLIFPHPPFEVEDPWYGLHLPGDMPARVAP